MPVKVLPLVDGTDCTIREPTVFNKKRWYSHKFNGPGVRYEIGLSILSGSFIWVFVLILVVATETSKFLKIRCSKHLRKMNSVWLTMVTHMKSVLHRRMFLLNSKIFIDASEQGMNRLMVESKTLICCIILSDMIWRNTYIASMVLPNLLHCLWIMKNQYFLFKLIYILKMFHFLH